MINPIKRLAHWGPLASMGITAALTVSTLSAKVGVVWILIFQLTMCLTLYNMWCATLIGPGYTLEPPPSPQEAKNKQQTKSKSSDRYCRRCRQVVLKKHHHCPWINNCVGLNNEQYFLRFLYFSIAVSLQSATLLIIDTCQRSATAILFNVLNISLSIGVILSISVLLYTH